MFLSFLLNCSNSIRKTPERDIRRVNLKKVRSNISADKQNEILESIKQDDLDKFRNIAPNNINEQLSEFDGATSLHLSILYSAESILDFLIDNADERVLDNYGNPPIFYTAFSGNEEILKKLLSLEGFWTQTAGSRNDDGERLIHIVARKNLYYFIPILREKLLNTEVLNAKTSDGRTPLQEAVGTFALNSIVALLNLGADHSIVTNRGNNIFHIAASAIPSEDIEVIDKNQENANIAYQEFTFLQKALDSGLQISDSKVGTMREIYEEAISKLEDSVIDINNNMFNLLLVLISGSLDRENIHTQLFRLLTSRNNRGFTPLHLAVLSENRGFILGLTSFFKVYGINSSNGVEGLLERYSSAVIRGVNSPQEVLFTGSRNRWGALELAIRAGKEDIVNLLLTLSPRVLDLDGVDRRIAVALQSLNTSNVDEDVKRRIFKSLADAQEGEIRRINTGTSVRVRLGRPQQNTSSVPN